jgi:solute carrier family 31 (copper transporter), member 1
MDHSGMDMGGGRCSMNVRPCRPFPVLIALPDQYQMLFTWSTDNLCIVFRQWRITGTVSLLVSLAAIALLTAGYEGVRWISRQYEQNHAARMSAFSSGASSGSPFVLSEIQFRTYQTEVGKAKLLKQTKQAHYWG